MAQNHSSRRVSLQSLRVDPTEKPDWPSGADRLPTPGDTVYCTAGMAEVVRVHGKTSDGIPLLELRLETDEKHPFFAASDNVLVADS